MARILLPNQNDKVTRWYDQLEPSTLLRVRIRTKDTLTCFISVSKLLRGPVQKDRKCEES